MLGIDISNHQGPPVRYSLERWYLDAEFVIVQAVDPPAPYPRGVTDPQLRQAKADGKYVGVYLWLWNSGSVVDDIRSKLALIPDDVQLDMRLWLDVEDTSSPFSADRCLKALQLCDEWASARGLPPTGIYTGDWYLNGYMGGWFPEGRMYWQADYGKAPELLPSRPVHQYQGSPIDLDAMLESEIITNTTEAPTVRIPQEYVDKFALGDDQNIQGLIDNFEGVISESRKQGFLSAVEAMRAALATVQTPG